jgi:hypothetical protein
MNERIQALAESAEIKFEAHPQHSGIVTAVITPADLEKFAKLIVRECAELATKEYNNRGAIHGNDLLQHFGVDE